MVDVNPNTSIITLNVNILIKRQRLFQLDETKTKAGEHAERSRDADFRTGCQMCFSELRDTS